MDSVGIQLKTTALYNPHENPTERMNRIIKTMIAQYTGNDHWHWDTHLAEIAFAINTAKNEASGFAQVEILFGKNLPRPKGLMEDHNGCKETEDFAE